MGKSITVFFLSILYGVIGFYVLDMNIKQYWAGWLFGTAWVVIQTFEE